MLYAVRVEYDTLTSESSFIDIVPFPTMQTAVAVFNSLMIAYPFGDQVTVRSKRTGRPEKIEIIDARLYEAEVSSLDAMVEAVRSGQAVLVDWTGELDG